MGFSTLKMGLLYVVMPVLKAFLPCNAPAKGPFSMHGAMKKRGTKQARHAPKSPRQGVCRGISGHAARGV